MRATACCLSIASSEIYKQKICRFLHNGESATFRFKMTFIHRELLAALGGTLQAA